MKKPGSILVVCGDRNWTNLDRILWWLNSIQPTVVIEGECQGADLLGRHAAEKLGIDVIGVPALWEARGRAAGPLRNRFQLSVALALAAYQNTSVSVAAFHNALQKSKGTKNMVNQAWLAEVDCVNITDSEALLIEYN